MNVKFFNTRVILKATIIVVIVHEVIIVTFGITEKNVNFMK